MQFKGTPEEVCRQIRDHAFMMRDVIYVVAQVEFTRLPNVRDLSVAPRMDAKERRDFFEKTPREILLEKGKKTERKCPKCSGGGDFDGKRCPKCGGEGFVIDY